ncbi:Phage-related baseplate assembly protein [Pseudomonas flavescens]|uniref:Phage-related baseplate assembly protein n=1 Tax=Phytopseudomonas flavescens TaxID=29435 RepID=A0A1G8JZY9_9GAMM|nr:baseplate J/gp47 family protein [Pseudomonas flavescens]SDI36751.1 Phage-related baseplate assembly protein [Pseudomonas flavescens]
MSFTAIDLSRVPAPNVVEALDYEQILGELLAEFAERYPAMDQFLESDPAIKLIEVFAYRELLLRQRINEAAKAVMLPYALGEDLENLGALFGVERLVTAPGDPTAFPPVPPQYESDSELRYRIQLSLEGLSTAGPEGAYVFHALSASGEVLDASAISPTPGVVLVTVLSRAGAGVPSAELLATVNSALTDESVRPLTDFVQVQAAAITDYAINARLYFYAGPDREVVMGNARAAVTAYAAAQHRLGRDVTISGLHAALHQPGVQRVELQSPAANIVVSRQGATFCTAIELTDGGLDE